jgi:hypothetical protein
VYPLRQLAFANAAQLGLVILCHPGYGNGGSKTQEYLKLLSKYRVHVATASRFGFALRKIIESVAVGCTPVTDLPFYDKLPRIDERLLRIEGDSCVSSLGNAIEAADRNWDLFEVRDAAYEAMAFYDYRASAYRITVDLETLKTTL